MVLDEGHEGDPDPHSKHQPIVHFDLKPNNSKTYVFARDSYLKTLPLRPRLTVLQS
jgi:hypothetical protein